MSKTVDFLHKAKVFYHSTVDGTEARVRPINSAIEYNGEIYFETSNNKEMYRQMLENPSFAVSGMTDGKWIRITGKAVMDETDDAKQAMFAALPALKEVYSYEELAPYYITDMKSVVYSFDKEPIELED